MNLWSGQHRSTMRSSLLRSFVIVIAALVLAVVAAAFVDGRLTIRALSQAMIGQAIDRADKDVEQFFEPVERVVVTASELATGGSLPMDRLLDNEGVPTQQFLNLHARLSGLLEFIPQTSSLAVADDAGHEFMVLKQSDEWISRVTRPGVGGVYFRWTDQAPAPTRAPELDRPEYDPRIRPWYKRGSDAPMFRSDLEFPAQKQSLAWTPPYRFFTARQLGITATSRTVDAGGSTRLVTVDVLLEDLSLFTMTNRIRDSGMVMVVSESFLEAVDASDDWVYTVGMPAGIEEVAGAEWRSRLGLSPEQLGVPVYKDAVGAFQTVVTADQRERLRELSRQELAREQTLQTAIPFKSGGDDWWLAVRMVPLGHNERLWIMGVVPESELVFGADRVQWGLAAALLIIFLVSIRHAVRLARYFSEPLETLAVENKRIAHGDLDKKVEVDSHLLEIQSLVEAQERMRSGLRTLMKLEGDLQLARRIQQATLPDNIPRIKRFEVAGWSEPAEETGGDTWDLIQRDDGRVWLFLADATGHGVGPALSVVQVRAMIRAIASMGTPLPEAVVRINNQLCVDLADGRFITLWFGELDPDTRSLMTYSAGQAPLIHYVARSDDFEMLPADACPFGIAPNTTPLSLRGVELKKNDLFAVMSDGVFEAENPDGEQMGVDRILDILRGQRGCKVEAILDAVRTELQAFTRGQPPRDDQTIVLVRGR